jgi:hypothetical protein
MFIAQQKSIENIAEYLLYMWQVEDLIRANDLDINKIEENIISKFDVDEDKKKQIVSWYADLIEMMRVENVQQSGHLQINNNVLINLTDLHKQLLFSQQHADYSATFYKALPFVTELKTKQSGVDNDIEVIFNFLYGVLLLRLQGKELSEETSQALLTISKFVALLALQYKLEKEGKLQFEK